LGDQQPVPVVLMPAAEPVVVLPEVEPSVVVAPPVAAVPQGIPLLWVRAVVEGAGEVREEFN